MERRMEIRNRLCVTFAAGKQYAKHIVDPHSNVVNDYKPFLPAVGTGRNDYFLGFATTEGLDLPDEAGEINLSTILLELRIKDGIAIV